jgi:glutathione peroxidase
LHKKYYQLGLRVLAFPSNEFLFQEYSTNAKIKRFLCKNSITFKVFQRIKVNGPQAHPIFKFLRYNITSLDNKAKKLHSSNRMRWNFTKFLLNREDKLFKRYEQLTEPFSFENDILNILTC